MAQSVELLLDATAEDAVRRQWAALAAAGLPSEQRRRLEDRVEERPQDRQHRPHLTLFAGDRIDELAERRLPELVGGLDLELVVGSVIVFGPRRDRCILVRSVLATEALLRLQARVAEVCGANRYGQFGPGRWSPHITLARRVAVDQVGPAVWTVGEEAIIAHVTECRRWDGSAKTAWLL